MDLPGAGSRSRPAAVDVCRDLVALLGFSPFAGVVPHVRQRAAGYVTAYERIVTPIVTSAVRDPVLRARAHSALRSAGVKLCFLVAGYASTAGIRLRTDLGVLAGVVTRAYDDLLDEFGCDDLDRRLTTLFDGGEFTPAGDMERLFHSIYREVQRRLARPASDPIFAALRRLHTFQIRSREQRDTRISPAELAEITRGKGGYGTLVIFALARPDMSEPEQRIILELGGVLQQLDDYQDAALDRLAGVTTAATRDELTLGDVCHRLRAIEPTLRAYYGSARPLYAMLLAYLVACFLGRRMPWAGRGGGPATSPLGILLRPGDNLVQRAADRHRR